MPARKQAVSVKLMTPLEHIFILQNSESFSHVSDRLVSLKHCETSFVDFLSEAVVNNFQGIVVGIKRKAVQKYKQEYN